MKRRGYTLVELIVVITVLTTLLGIAVSMLAALMRTQDRGKAHAEQKTAIAQLADQFRRDVHEARGTPQEEPEKGKTNPPAPTPIIKIPPFVPQPTTEPPGAPWVPTPGGYMMGSGMPGPPGAMGPAGGPGGPAVPPAPKVRPLRPQPYTREPAPAAARHSGPAWWLDLGSGRAVRYWLAGAAVVREESVNGKTVASESYVLPEDYRAGLTFDKQGPTAEVHLTIAPRDARLRRGHQAQIDAVLGRDHRFAAGEKGGK